MTKRNTNTGAVLEAMVLPALTRGGYTCRRQVAAGSRLGGKGRHFVDAIACKDGVDILVSLKWQQTSGTAEQKVPFEVMCLAEVVRAGTAQRAYLVLGGDGWTLRDYYVSGALNEHLIHSSLVQVVTLEAFIRLANNAQL
ncbi:MAG: PD-(D/E)XK nuclease superfamily protein [Vicinamibacterales bacterium]